MISKPTSSSSFTNDNNFSNRQLQSIKPTPPATATTSACVVSSETPFLYGRAPDGTLEVHSLIPDGIVIGEGPFGRNMIATKKFPKGSLMYKAYSAIVQYDNDNESTQQQQGENTKEAEQYEERNKAPDAAETSASSSSSSSACSSSSSNNNNNANEFVLHMYKHEDGALVLVETTVMDETQSVLDVENPNEIRRQCFGFDGFMNHSCDPNCWFVQVSKTSDLMVYDTIALKDVEIGDEITCDYATFDYDCDGHDILVCGCKAANCRGSMRGFVGLDLDEKVRIMHRCEDEILERFFQDNSDNIVLLHSSLPDGVSLIHQDDDKHHHHHCSSSSSSQSSSDYKYLCASRRFEQGQVVFRNKGIIIPKKHEEDNHQNNNRTYILKVDGRYVLLDPTEHFIHRPTFMESIGFDSFMDHSCNPNTHQIYHNDTEYTVYANRTILPGDRLTCDYNQLENQATDVPIVPATKFDCQCGEANCRGLIHA